MIKIERKVTVVLELVSCCSSGMDKRKYTGKHARYDFLLNYFQSGDAAQNRCAQHVHAPGFMPQHQKKKMLICNLNISKNVASFYAIFNKHGVPTSRAHDPH